MMTFYFLNNFFKDHCYIVYNKTQGSKLILCDKLKRIKLYMMLIINF